MRIGTGIMAVLATWAMAESAGATALHVTGYTLGEQVDIRSGSSRGSVYATEFQIGYLGDEGYSYSIDLTQRIGLGATTGWNAWSVQASSGVVRAAWLVDRFRGTPGDRTTITGLQLAIWEALADANEPAGYDLFSGTFALETGGASNAATSLARSFLGELASADLSGFFTRAEWLTNARYQDQVAFTRPIPEPSSIVMFGFGAALVARVVARKKT